MHEVTHFSAVYIIDQTYNFQRWDEILFENAGDKGDLQEILLTIAKNLAASKHLVLLLKCTLNLHLVFFIFESSSLSLFERILLYTAFSVMN